MGVEISAMLVGNMASIGDLGTAILVGLTFWPSKHSAFDR
jgi:hypothetical protein